MQLTLREIFQTLNPSGVAEAAATVELNAVASGYSIDTRTLKPGELFFAIRGPRFDGHDFVGAAAEKGACGAVVAADWVARQKAHATAASRSPKRNWIVVPDPALSLQELAAQVRRWWGGQVAGVTGSAGKTTVKEILATLLGSWQHVSKSEGNLNNLYGVPLTLLRMDAGARIAVLELAMSARGEIRRLTQIAAPDVAVVTNVNPVHLKFFESVEEIALAKRELVEELGPGGVAVLNADDPRVASFAAHTSARVVTYGLADGADVRIENVNLSNLEGSRFDIRLKPGKRILCSLSLLGRHNIFNAAAAIAAVLELGLTPREVEMRLPVVRPARMRGEIVRLEGGVTVLDDTYNSNPRALQEMISTLASLQGFRRRVVAAGEMLELGETSRALHAACGKAIAEAGVDVLIATQGDAEAMASAAREAGMKSENIFFCSTPDEAGKKLCDLIRAGDLVLLKGSRGVRMEVALDGLRRKFSLKAH